MQPPLVALCHPKGCLFPFLRPLGGWALEGTGRLKINLKKNPTGTSFITHRRPAYIIWYSHNRFL